MAGWYNKRINNYVENLQFQAILSEIWIKTIVVHNPTRKKNSQNLTGESDDECLHAGSTAENIKVAA